MRYSRKHLVNSTSSYHCFLGHCTQLENVTKQKKTACLTGLSVRCHFRSYGRNCIMQTVKKPEMNFLSLTGFPSGPGGPLSPKSPGNPWTHTHKQDGHETRGGTERHYHVHNAKMPIWMLDVFRSWFVTEVFTPNTGDQQSVSQNRSLQSKAKQIPSITLPVLSFLGDRQEIPRQYVSKRWVCGVLSGLRTKPPGLFLNGWIKLLGPGIADCAFFLLGARNSIIEAEQEAWCSHEATRSSCACQHAKVNTQLATHHGSALHII